MNTGAKEIQQVIPSRSDNSQSLEGKEFKRVVKGKFLPSLVKDIQQVVKEEMPFKEVRVQDQESIQSSTTPDPGYLLKQ